MSIIHAVLMLVGSSLFLSGCSTYSKTVQHSVSHISATSEQKELYKSLKPLSKHPRAQIGRYLDSANTARLQLATKPDDVQARSDYNFAVSRILEIINIKELTPWRAPLECDSGEGTPWSLKLRPIDSNPQHSLDLYELRCADLVEFKGKLVGERNVKSGLGAPLIAVAKNLDYGKYETTQGEEKRYFYGLTAVLMFNKRSCEIVLFDPLSMENLSYEGHRYPLAADFQAPLAMALANLNMKKRELSGMFKPKQHIGSSRLATLQPYSSDKIPVLFIHGLGNSPATWAPMLDFLRSDASIRKRYQFWFFSYPTGVPYPTNAALLREQLLQMKKRYPDHKNIVILAHSLGGNIARLLITDSGMKLWDQFYDKAPADIPFSPETRRALSEAFIFKAQTDISRVIFASASLRGSNVATRFIGKLGTKLIGDPIAEKNITKEAFEFARPEIQAMGLKRLPNSVEILDPDSVLLKAINDLPINPNIPYHTLIGDRGKGGNLDHRKPVSTDGIVPYWSSHLVGAVSEKVIPSKHWSILHPQGMAEVKRILLAY